MHRNVDHAFDKKAVYTREWSQTRIVSSGVPNCTHPNRPISVGAAEQSHSYHTRTNICIHNTSCPPCYRLFSTSACRDHIQVCTNRIPLSTGRVSHGSVHWARCSILDYTYCLFRLLCPGRASHTRDTIFPRKNQLEKEALIYRLRDQDQDLSAVTCFQDGTGIWTLGNRHHNN